MAETILPLEPQTLAADVCELFDLGEEAEELLLNGQTADEFFSLLQQKKLYFDAIRMLATVLHKLYVVEWTCLAVRSDLNQKMDDKDKPLIEIAEKWVQEPTEANRRIAMESAEAGGYETAACWTAAAAGWTGGSLAPADFSLVPPADDLTAKAASGALSMIAVQNSAQIEKRAGLLVDMGLEFAKKPIPEPLYGGAATPLPAAPEPTPVAAPAPPPVAAPPVPTPAPAPPPAAPPLQPKPAAPTFQPSPKQAPQSPGPSTWSTDPL